MDILEAARNGDFYTAKERLDKAVASGKSTLDELLNQKDRRGRSVAHYAAQFDDVAVFEWLYNMGADLFVRDGMNKSAVEIAVLKKKGKGGEVMSFLKDVVLNPIEQVFYIENGESCESVACVQDISKLSLDDLSKRFPHHNEMQALHVFSLCGKFDELEYLKARGVDMKAVDEDGNSALHFASSERIASYLIQVCGIDVNLKNQSDGYTAAHSVVNRVAMEELVEAEGISILSCLKNNGADFGIKSESENLDVLELAVELMGDSPFVKRACAEGLISSKKLDELLNSQNIRDDESDLSIASHDDKVIAESSDEDDNNEQEEDKKDDDEDDEEGEEDDNADIINPFQFRKK